MFKVGIGQFEDIDTNYATKNALDRAKISLGGHYPNAGIVFAGQDYEHGLMLAIIQEEFPGLSVIPIAKSKLSEIKSEFTFGNWYMCASGLPEKRDDHAVAIVRAAWEIQNFMESDKQQRITDGRRIWELRIGINSGSLVAGVIGRKKFT